MTAFLVHDGFVKEFFGAGEGDVWDDGPTENGTIVYSVITPIICIFGIIGNTLSLLVLWKKELSGSIFTYLAVLAVTDLCMSIADLLSGLSRGALWYYGWVIYDALIGLPVCGAINSLGVWATVAVTIDRVVYLWNPVQSTRPKMCSPHYAKQFMFVAFLIAIVFNIPYCFIFTRLPNGQLVTTDFFDSRYYLIFNWVYLAMFAFIPAIVLIVGNGILIKSLQKAKKISRKCSKKCRKKDHINLTITLIAIIVMFLISEIPASLVSRTTAISILYNGNHDGPNCQTMEIIRQVCTLIGALNLAANFVFYYLFCPPFCRVLRKMFRIRGDVVRTKTLQVNVFVLDGQALKIRKNSALGGKDKEKIVEIATKRLEGAFPTGRFVAGLMERTAGSESSYINNFTTNEADESEYIDLDATGFDRHNYTYLPPYSTIIEESETSSCSSVSGENACAEIGFKKY